jgi:elongation factor P
MATINTNQFKAGVKIMLDGDPYSIVENEMVKPGKGNAFNRVRIKNLKTGRVIEKTMRSGDSVEAADVIDEEMKFLYGDGKEYHFMNPNTFDQLVAGETAMGDAAKWLKGEEICMVTLWNGEPIAITAPNFVTLKITQTDPGLRGDTAQGGVKPVTLETGAVVKGPLFLEIGDLLKIDTRTGEYSSRGKE